MGLVEIRAFEAGSNDLSPAENKLATSFEQLDRKDLAHCVRTGKVHQRLRAMIGGIPSIGMIRGLTDAVGLGQTSEVSDLATWCETVWVNHRLDEVLSRLVNEEEMTWKERCEAEVYFDWL